MSKPTSRPLPPLPPFDTQRTRLAKVCDVCGQHFDSDDQEQVFHHRPEPHGPLKPQ